MIVLETTEDTGSLCLIVLETTEEKSWINSFDLPPPNEDVHSWGFILTLIVDRLRVFVRIIL